MNEWTKTKLNMNKAQSTKIETFSGTDFKHCWQLKWLKHMKQETFQIIKYWLIIVHVQQEKQKLLYKVWWHL